MINFCSCWRSSRTPHPAQTCSLVWPMVQTTRPDVPTGQSWKNINILRISLPRKWRRRPPSRFTNNATRRRLKHCRQFRSSPSPFRQGMHPAAGVESFPQLIKLSAVHFVRFQLSLGLYRVPHPQQSQALVVIPISASSSKQRQTATIIMSCRRNKKKHVINLQCNHGRLANCAQRISSIVTPYLSWSCTVFNNQQREVVERFFFCSR